MNDDKLIAPTFIRQDQIYKKCKTLGEELRYISLGLKQLIISKDKELLKIVNIIPIERGMIIMDFNLESKCKFIKNTRRVYKKFV